MNKVTEFKNKLTNNDKFINIDIVFGEFLYEKSSNKELVIFYFGSLLSNKRREGDICISLKAEIKKKFFVSCFPGMKIEKLTEILKNSGVVGEEKEYKPLILDKFNNLYMQKFYIYEENLCRKIKKMVENKRGDLDINGVSNSLQKLFSNNNLEIDYQKVAVISSLYSNFLIVSGGPGTGKTTTVSKIIAFLLMDNPHLKIALSAPTGKASNRLLDAVKKSIDKLNIDESIKEKIPKNSYTLHRLLGARENSIHYKYNENNKLPFNLVVVDEASMIDLPMISSLFSAIKDEVTKVILLGDRNQLSSVEVGVVLGDICNSGNKIKYSNDFFNFVKKISGYELETDETLKSGINDSIVELRKNYRSESKKIVELAEKINIKDSDEVLKILKANMDETRLIKLINFDGFLTDFKKIILEKYSSYIHEKDIIKSFRKFNEFKVLAATRIGSYGVENLNRLTEKILIEENLISGGKFYDGQPIIIKRNDYSLGLFNGDMAIVRSDKSDNNLYAYFVYENDEFRKIRVNKLSYFELSYAITIHKSQGSEFNSVSIVIGDKKHELLTKELLYTAVTRAKKNVEIWGSEEILKYMISRNIERTSGIKRKLWKMID